MGGQLWRYKDQHSSSYPLQLRHFGAWTGSLTISAYSACSASHSILVTALGGDARSITCTL
jgi:hypothetical protein